MQQRIFSEASSSLASQKIPRVLRDPKVQNRVQKSPQLVPNLSQSSPRPSPVIFLKIHSNIILPRYVRPCQHDDRRALWFLTYEGQLWIFWTSSSGQATRSGPPTWGLGDVLTNVHRCTMLWNGKESLRRGQMLRDRQTVGIVSKTSYYRRSLYFCYQLLSATKDGNFRFPFF